MKQNERIMAKLKKIKVLSLAIFQGVLFGHLGLVAGVLYSFGGAIYDIFTTGSVNFGTALAFLALIAMPILFAVFGFILGIIEAVLYNFLATWHSGIETDF